MVRSMEQEDARTKGTLTPIRFLEHPSFQEKEAAASLAEGGDEPLDEKEFGAGYMPDEVTRATARKMHYAAYRASRARKMDEVVFWRARYFHLRDRIILGNRKLIFGAVKRKGYHNNSADDLIGECYIVMIRVVAAYNPWIGIRFSTYACTCLMRALSRLNQRSLSDRLAQSLTIDQTLDEEPVQKEVEEPGRGVTERIDAFLHRDHDLLTDREKVVLKRRFHLGNSREDATLEKVGRDLGISKERVRQVQASALAKLRQALTT